MKWIKGASVTRDASHVTRYVLLDPHNEIHGIGITEIHMMWEHTKYKPVASAAHTWYMSCKEVSSR